MKAETKEWVAKAEGDFHDVLRGIRARKNPNFDSVCFHAEQCIEKYLKASLVEAGKSFPKTHDLSKILDIAVHWSRYGRRGGPNWIF
jgi:HEPN domain-containing protein